MSCALFGKLPAKRDFVAVNVPRELLRLWEVWLQGAMSASMLGLGPGWKQTYLTAPIWRFWLGSGHAGTEVMGALMPSLDGIGRDFPLAVFAAAPADGAFASPIEDAQDGWFDRVESFLLDCLEPELAYDGVIERLAALPAPATIARPPLASTLAPTAGMLAATGAADASPALVLAMLARAERQVRLAHASYWWTIGGENVMPLALRSEGMPQAEQFAAMLSGRFEPQAEAAAAAGAAP